MAVEITIPSVGESITEVTIAEWLKKDGDYVEQDEIVVEVETDKASQEFPAESSGTLRIKVEEGETVDVGTVIGLIEEGEGSPSKDEGKEEAPKEESTSEESTASSSSSGEEKEITMTVPSAGESITEVTLANISKSNGESVEMDEVICELESDKATFEVPAEAGGTIEWIASEGDTLEIGATLCKIKVGAASEKSSSESKESSDTKPDPMPASDTSGESTYATGHASPAAAKILKEKGIDSSQVKGTGKDGRITKEDAEKAQKSAPKSASAPAKEQKAEASQDAPQYASAGISRETERKKMSSLRKTVARRLVSVKNETAMLTTFNEVNMQPIMDIRKKYKEMFKEKHEVGLGFMSFFTKACCQALQEWPAVNAMIDGNEMIYNHFCDVSIAVSSPRGLVVPVIRNAEALDFKGIESEVVRLAKKARDNKLSIEEMTGGTFTITNGGIFGSMMSTPIINAPQSAILGMHNIVQRPMAVNGEVKILPMMYVALSYDHRIIDGKESVSFLVRVKELLEDPTRLLIGV